MSSMEIEDILSEEGFNIKNHTATLSDEHFDAIEKYFLKKYNNDLY